jgi:alkylhydroperoxidase/carboxymuconolactone decarboxylase family protein YurZ
MYMPEIFETLREQYPEIVDTYQKVGELCANAGPIDDKNRHLVQLGIAVGCSSRGAVRSHARRALEAGATEKEIVQAVLLAMPIIGFPATVGAYDWIRSIVDEESKKS